MNKSFKNLLKMVSFNFYFEALVAPLLPLTLQAFVRKKIMKVLNN